MNAHSLDPGLRASKLFPLAIVGLTLMSALFIGLLATTNDFAKIGMGLGLVGGAFLIAAPKLVIWLVIILGMATGALISMAGPAYAKLPWAFALLSFLLWPVALLHMLNAKRVAAFIWIAIGFVLLCIVTTAVQWHSFGEFVAGFKRYFQTYGLMFALAVLPFVRSDMAKWKKAILFIALLQLPFALYEFIVLVPLRGGLAHGSEATDVVAGTFSANLTGGSSNAEMAAFLVIMIGFLLSRWRAHLLGAGKTLLLILLCLIPLGLGETKIVLVLLPLVAFILLRKDFFRSPLRYLPAVLAVIAVTALLAWIYVTVMIGASFSFVLENTLRYNIENVGYGDALLNRSTVYEFWWQRHGWHDPVSLLFGHGIGASFWAPNNPIAGHIGRHFPGYSIDLTTISTLLWDVGIVGLVLYLSMLVGAWMVANRLWRKAEDPMARADALAIQGAIAVFGVFLFYSSSAVNLLPFQVLIAAVLGYLAWMWREYMPAAQPATSKALHIYQPYRKAQ